MNCMNCGSDDALETHHVFYYPERRVVLCKKCHTLAHTEDGHPYSPKQDPSDLFKAPSNREDVPNNATVTVKRINKNSYFYWNWRDGKKIRSEYICSVAKAETHELFSATHTEADRE